MSSWSYRPLNQEKLPILQFCCLYGIKHFQLNSQQHPRCTCSFIDNSSRDTLIERWLKKKKKKGGEINTYKLFNQTCREKKKTKKGNDIYSVHIWTIQCCYYRKYSWHLFLLWWSGLKFNIRRNCCRVSLSLDAFIGLFYLKLSSFHLIPLSCLGNSTEYW